MRFTSFLAGLALLFAAASAQVGAPPTIQKSFIWEGNDSLVDCTEGASAFLTVETFEFLPFIVGGPTNLADSTIVDFFFESDSGMFNGFDFQGGTGTGVLFGTPDEQADVTITGTAFVDSLFGQAFLGEPILIDFFFNTSVQGTWTVFGFISEGGFDDIGASHAFNPVSEPGVLALLGVGLIGLAAMRRLRQAA